METPRGRRAILPVIYGGAVLLLLVAALFLRGFSRDVGDARVAGRFTLTPLFSSRSLENLTLSWNGLAFHFSRSTSPGLSGFEAREGMTDIVLAGGARLRLTPGSDAGGSLTITPVSPSSVSSQGSLVIPFTLAGFLTDAPAGEALAWVSAGKAFLLSLPSSARVDADARTISLPMDASTWSAGLSVAGTPAVAGVSRAGLPATASPAVRTTRLPDEKSLPTDDQLQAAVTGWTRAAWAGWSGSRFSAESALWRMPDGSMGFSEDIGVALLAESVARGSWQTFVPLWADAMARQQARAAAVPLSFTTSAFTGGTRDFARVNSERTAALLAQAQSLLASSDNALLRIPGLVTLLLDHGTQDLFTAALAFLTGRNSSSLDVPTALGLLEALVDMAEKSGLNDASRRALQDVVSRRILPALRSTDAGLFLDSGAGTADVAAGIRCGALLARAGAALGDTRTAAVGRGLLVAALGLADNSGTMPATLRLASAAIESRTGTVAPESLYALLPTGRLLPRETSLSRQAGPGVSLWTAATLVSAVRSGTTLRLVLGYPAGVPYYFVIQGIGAFNGVQIHGIPWHADPSFAKYTNGWAFDGAAGMFHGKLTGRTASEEIDITF